MFKRIALGTVVALGVGLVSAVSPANAGNVSSIAAAVGPNGATSLTVVNDGATDSATAALVRVDITVDSATSAGTEALACTATRGETVTATVTAVPGAKTLIANGGSLADTGTLQTNGQNSVSDLVMIEVAGQSSGTSNAVSGASTTGRTNWGNHAYNSATRSSSMESFTPTASDGRNTKATDGQLSGCNGMNNTPYYNMDGLRQSASNNNTFSYYVSIAPRGASRVVDQGFYTVSFRLEANGVVIGTASVKIEFVSTASVSGATLALASSGTFIESAALTTSDSTGATYANLTLRNRESGLVRLADGSAPVPSVRIEESTTAAPTWAETGTLFASDTGTAGLDFGNAAAGGTGTLVKNDGVYGLYTSVLPSVQSSTTAGALRSYRFWAGYGNAPIQTLAFTLFDASGTGGASAGNTDVLVTATGMSAADQALISGTAASPRTSKTWTIPTTTTSATVKFTIQTSADVAAGAQEITVKPTWSGAIGTANVTPATSTTGTVYTTDASGNFTVTVTNSAPVAGASVALALSGGAAFGSGTYTATLTWAAPTATTIEVVDPLTGVYVATGSTNVTTVLVKDQFGSPVANQAVTVSLGLTSANYSATTTIAPITTGAAGTATYSLKGGATTATLDTLTFQCAPTACTAAGAGNTMTYNYVTTVPAVGTLTGYYNQDWNASAVSAGTLVPVTGDIYASGSTAETLAIDINTSKPLGSYADANSDALVSLAFRGLTAAGVAATGAVITVTAGEGGHILDASDLPVKSRTFLVGTTGYTSNIRVLATGTGDVTFTATNGSVSTKVTLKVENQAANARFITVSSSTTGTANGAGVPVTVTVTDRFGNPVSGVDLVIRASGVGALMGGSTSTSFRTDALGTYTFLATSYEAAGGAATFTASSGTSADFGSLAGFVGATEVDSTLKAGNSSASATITFAAGEDSAKLAAEAATDAALEAIDAANAATDAANLAAEAADAATVAAEEARDAADAATAAVEALASEVATLIAGLKAQITTLANTVAKIAKKVRA